MMMKAKKPAEPAKRIFSGMINIQGDPDAGANLLSGSPTLATREKAALPLPPEKSRRDLKEGDKEMRISFIARYNAYA